MLSLVLALSLQSPAVEGSPLRFVLLEDFDQPGSGLDWSATLFPAEIKPGGTAFTREPLTVAQGAPNTTPPLPINAGGDLEGRYAEVTVGGGSYALTTPEVVLENGGIRAFVAIGAPDPFGSQSGGVLVRASVNPNPPFGTGVNGYTAEIARNGGGNPPLFYLARWRDGVITPSDIFVSVPFAADFSQENYLIALQAEADLLVARLWRVRAEAGAVVIEPVVLPGGGNTISARDDELRAGRLGVHAFARGQNSVFFEDVQIGTPADRPGTLRAVPLPLFAAPPR